MVSGRFKPALLRGFVAMGMTGVLSCADARMVTRNVCQWFGTGPACAGECPAGWTQSRRSSSGDSEFGAQCTFGSKAYCCDFREYCVPDNDPSWHPGAQRTLDDGTIECQVCNVWGDDCVRGGGPRFQTACSHYIWQVCGRTQPRKPISGSNIGFPTPVPVRPHGAQFIPRPRCDPPRVRYPQGFCGCPTGLTGPSCDSPVVR